MSFVLDPVVFNPTARARFVLTPRLWVNGKQEPMVTYRMPEHATGMVNGIGVTVPGVTVRLDPRTGWRHHTAAIWRTDPQRTHATDNARTLIISVCREHAATIDPAMFTDAWKHALGDATDALTRRAQQHAAAAETARRTADLTEAVAAGDITIHPAVNDGQPQRIHIPAAVTGNDRDTRGDLIAELRHTNGDLAGWLAYDPTVNDSTGPVIIPAAAA